MFTKQSPDLRGLSRVRQAWQAATASTRTGRATHPREHPPQSTPTDRHRAAWWPSTADARVVQERPTSLTLPSGGLGARGDIHPTAATSRSPSDLTSDHLPPWPAPADHQHGHPHHPDAAASPHAVRPSAVWASSKANGPSRARRTSGAARTRRAPGRVRRRWGRAELRLRFLRFLHTVYCYPRMCTHSWTHHLIHHPPRTAPCTYSFHRLCCLILTSIMYQFSSFASV